MDKQAPLLNPLSRRQFMRLGASATAGLSYWQLSGCNSEAPSNSDAALLLAVLADGRLSFTLPRAEMGQGLNDAFAQVFCRHAGLTLQQIEMQFATADKKYGWQMTVGSTTMKIWYARLEALGVSLNYALRQQASRLWQLPLDDCICLNGRISNRQNASTLSAVELLQKLELSQVKQASLADLSPEHQSQLQARQPNTHSLKAPTIARGAYTYCADQQDQNQLKAVSLVLGAEAPSAHDLEQLKQRFGLSDYRLLELNSYRFVALLATKTWPLLKAKQQLKQQLAGSGAEQSQSRFDQQTQTLKAGIVKRDDGGLDGHFFTPFLSQAPLEPCVCLATFNDGELYLQLPTQAPQIVQREAAKLLGLQQQQVTVQMTALGGSFGRKRYTDFALEAALIAKHFGSICLQWELSDSLEREFYRPACWQSFSWTPTSKQIQAQRIEAAPPGSADATADKLELEWLRLPAQTHIKHLAGPYKTGIMRAVEYAYTGFAQLSFIDAIAAQQNLDPLDFYRQQLQSESLLQRLKQNDYRFQPKRMLHLLEQCAQMANWQQREVQQRHLGLAAFYLFNSYIVAIAELADSAELKVKKLYLAADCGKVAHKDGLQAQLEGGAQYALSACLMGQITPAAKPSNFDSYQVLRMSDAVPVESYIAANQHDPSGAGELAMPVIAPAIANAWFAKTQQRLCKMPFME